MCRLMTCRWTQCRKCVVPLPLLAQAAEKARQEKMERERVLQRKKAEELKRKKELKRQMLEEIEEQKRKQFAAEQHAKARLCCP